ncbi:TMN2 [Candida pseudojiufengensis]|uniref:TMN2 n=1 Tax=Candida pseudojiufengensis TaxID=497109 RepID=UPI0022251E49|nr:TMN2 [Candida pseudojiufengensis]KAI5965689.1 TMN2 [Candida pseudojiufengensis]
MLSNFVFILTILLVNISKINSFYLPGVAPTDYKQGEQIPLLVNHLTPSLHHVSHQNKIKSATYVYSYDYYYPKFHFCQPEGGPKKQSESLGSIIFGDRIFNSPFDIKMLEPVNCKQLCTSTYPKSDAVFVNRNIRASYSHNWLVDGLPVARIVEDQRTNSQFYGTGFHIGEVNKDHAAVLYNHFDIKIEYHKRGENQFRVVGVTATPASLDRSELPENSPADAYCSVGELKQLHLDKDKDTEVLFTYSVRFEESDIVWATRWDQYLHVYDPKIQWFSLINFSLIVLILGIVIAHILIRTLKNDIVKYNEVNLDDDLTDESGWKLIHGDVFRSPPQRQLLSILVGSGVQIFFMAFVTIIFALFGLLSPSNRGSLSTFMFVVYMLSSIISSFVSGYIYRFLGGEDWKTNLILTPILVPGGLFGIFIFLNFFLISVESSGALPMGTMVTIIGIWFVVSIPLSVVGSILASKRPLLDIPVRTNQIPRQIPQQPWYLKLIPIMFISGIFPFGSIAVEMYFIYSSLWFNKIFYMFGFLFFCFLLMTLTTSLITILMIYYTLCSENYKWQWKSICIGGGCAIYVFIHSIFLTGGEKLGGLTSFVLYIGYSIVISLLVFLCCSSIGFISSLLFVRTIYAQIKID